MKQPELPTVYVIDEDSHLREVLCSHLRAAGLQAQAYGSAEAFLSEHTDAMEGCVVADVRLPEMGGVALIGALARRGNRLPVIETSRITEPPLVVEAMRAGAADFLSKPLEPAAVLKAVLAAMDRGRIPATLRSEAAIAAERLTRLSTREREVFDGLASGSSAKQLAHALAVSPKTIETYRVRLIEKLRVDTTYALVRLAVLISVFIPEATRSRGGSSV